MSIQSEELKERSRLFAVSILGLIEQFPKTIGGQLVARQLAKCATSVGANYRAVCGARSDSEFVAKLCIVNEEADESVYWLEIAANAKYLPDEKLVPHSNEAIELRAIFGRSLGTVRRRLNARTTK